ncbi:MAG: hypothetical protein AAFP68_06285 [Pseudomonadota bacterium]
MSDKPALSENMQRIADGLRAHGQAPVAVFCGFDLWIEVLGSQHISLKDFAPGGKPATGQEDKDRVPIVPLIVLGGQIVVCLDPTIEPGEFYFKP